MRPTTLLPNSKKNIPGDANLVRKAKALNDENQAALEKLRLDYENYNRTGCLGSTHGCIPLGRDSLFHALNDRSDKVLSDRWKRSAARKLASSLNGTEGRKRLPLRVAEDIMNTLVCGEKRHDCKATRTRGMSDLVHVRESFTTHYKLLLGRSVSCYFESLMLL